MVENRIIMKRHVLIPRLPARGLLLPSAENQDRLPDTSGFLHEVELMQALLTAHLIQRL